MARIDDALWKELTGPKGDQFEYQVWEHLRQRLPESYWLAHNVKLEEGRTLWEIDLIVAGPNGLFLIEAKYKQVVEGYLHDRWVYQQKDSRGRLINQQADRTTAEKMRKKMIVAGNRARTSGENAFKYLKARVIFVFPDEAEVHLKNNAGKEVTQDVSGSFFWNHLSGLAQRIEQLNLAEGLKKELTANQVEKLIRLFKPAADRWPDQVGPYKILTQRRDAVIVAPNGLPYTIHKLKHSMLDYLRRGRCYNLKDLGNKDRALFEEQVKRHAKVLASIGPHPHIINFKEFLPDAVNDECWVIEDWHAGETLAEVIKRNGQKTLDPRVFMRGIAEGLLALHNNKFIYRDLTPDAIIVELESERPLLTNFETARDLDGSPTVSAGEDRRQEYYVAPEVLADPGAAKIPADLYSWAAIFHHLTTGEPYRRRMEQKFARIERTGLPPMIVELIKNCLNDDPGKRPPCVDEILKVMKSW